MRFLSIEHARANQRRLGLAVSLDSPATYRESIAALRHYPCATSGISISFEDDEISRYISQLGCFDDIFTDIRSTSEPDRRKSTDQVSEALDLLRSADRSLSELIGLIVTDIVFMPANRVGGGSASHLPGIVCISPGDEWGAAEIAETLVHEAVHLNAFLGEMVNGTYNVPIARLAKKDARVLSAVRIGDMRPLDKALHSALVAVPLMYLQHLRGESALVDLFTQSLRDCFDGLVSRRSFFTSYGWAVVQDLGRFAGSLDYEAVRAGLRASDSACRSDG